MTDFVIVDTDVVSFLLKGDTRAQAYRPHLQNKSLALSFMTLAEFIGGPMSGNGDKHDKHGWKSSYVHTSLCPLTTTCVNVELTSASSGNVKADRFQPRTPGSLQPRVTITAH